MCNKYWRTEKLFEHLGRLLHERVLYPYDGSIELEMDGTVEILTRRGLLV